jgi:hypothetical protein
LQPRAQPLAGQADDSPPVLLQQQRGRVLVAGAEAGGQVREGGFTGVVIVGSGAELVEMRVSIILL